VAVLPHRLRLLQVPPSSKLLQLVLQAPRKCRQHRAHTEMGVEQEI